MQQLIPFSDNRLTRGCIYCGGFSDTRDHVPSKCLLDKPYPENLPVVGCCFDCNQSFSSDEIYFACFIECVKSGSTKLDQINREYIKNILLKTPSLHKRIENSTKIQNEQIEFYPEQDRIKNVLLKLARGHTAFELSIVRRDEPYHFWFGLIDSLPEANQIEFNSVHFQQNFGEVGSRSMQRFLVITLIKEDGNQNLIINDWLDVQDNKYRYITIDDMGMIIVRIVIDEIWGCEMAWEH